MWNPETQGFWIATNPLAFNKAPSTSENTDLGNVRLTIGELIESVKAGHPHCDPVGLNQSGRPGWDESLNEVTGPFPQRHYKDSPRSKNNSYLSNLVMMESDGDAELETALESPLLRKRCTAIWTSCSHGLKTNDNGISDRFRLGFVLGRTLETFHDSDEYTNPHWQLEAVWDWIHENIVCPSLDIESLSDKSGREAARQFFGCTPDHKIGLGSIAELYPNPCEAYLLGGGLDALLVNQILDEAEPRYLKNQSTSYDDFDYADIEGTEELSFRDVNIVCWILNNGILNDTYATDRNLWFTVGRILKKYDHSGQTFFDAFCTFSEQCTDASKRETRDELYQTWLKLPDGEDTKAKLNTIKSYATKSSPNWRTHCPFYGSTTTMSKAIKPFVSGAMSLRGEQALAALESTGLFNYELELLTSFEARRALLEERLVTPTKTLSDSDF